MNAGLGLRFLPAFFAFFFAIVLLLWKLSGRTRRFLPPTMQRWAKDAESREACQSFSERNLLLTDALLLK
jgi:hypothetical protein